MKNAIIGGVEITDKIINLLSDLQEPNEDSDDAPRINYYVKCLSDTQDFICRKLSRFNEQEMQEVAILLKSLVFLKDDLHELIIEKQ